MVVELIIKKGKGKEKGGKEKEKEGRKEGKEKEKEGEGIENRFPYTRSYALPDA
jgi:hypothetical protein